MRHGFGTERLEREVQTLLPGVELLRLDSDVAASYHRLRAVLDRFAAPGAKVLVGTQMIAKGHHFPEVTLVGVVNADVTLHFPDFRAEEHTFAMLIQVAGRSGRGERPGRVVVQTLSPEARPIVAAVTRAEEQFYAEELDRRRELGYPPSGQLVALELSGYGRGEGGRRRPLHGGEARRAPAARRAGPRPRAAVAGARASRLPRGGEDGAKRAHSGQPAPLAGGRPRQVRGARRAAGAGRRPAVAVEA